MAGMQLVYRSTCSELSPQERVAVFAEERAKGKATKIAARALCRIMRGGHTNADVQTVLQQLSFHSSTTVPKHYLLASPSSKRTSSQWKQHPHILNAQTHNRSYACRLRRQRRASIIEDHYFRVPKTPLPLSYEAQCDIDYVAGRQHRGRVQVDSGYAPLFSKSSTWTPEAMTTAERCALQCLTPPERSPMMETLEKLKSQGHYKPSDPMARIRFNEPAHMPNLHRRIPAECVPACSTKPTMCFEKHCEGNAERATHNMAAKEYATWHW
ncbi:hypothetical protein MNV84_03472 [Leishmania braziliensis]|nr:hypothetical protein MNV84_03472 [Leishmania braziliensis]